MTDRPAERPMPASSLSPREVGELLYQGIFGRVADAGGLETLVTTYELAGPDGLAALIGAFVESPEFRSRRQAVLSDNAFLFPAGTTDLLVLDMTEPQARRCLGDGRHSAERSFVWAGVGDSTLQFDALEWDDDALLFLDMVPNGHPTHLHSQRIEVYVNGFEVGRFETRERTPRTFMCEVSRDILTAKAGLSIRLHLPDGIRPNSVPDGPADDRLLSFALRECRMQRLTPRVRADRARLQHEVAHPIASSRGRPHEPLTIAYGDLLSRFESLGHNCEFGFVQRNGGIEPVSLLRFTGIPFHKLIKGIRSRFEGIASPGNFFMEVVEHLPHEGYMGRDDTYLLYYHTEQPVGSTDVAKLLVSENLRMRFLARKLMEDLEDGDKIFVVKSDGGIVIEELLSLLDLLQSIGPSILLWVDKATADHPAGSVDVIRPGLMKGYIDEFSELDIGPHTTSYDCWRLIVENAHALRDLAKPVVKGPA